MVAYNEAEGSKDPPLTSRPSVARTPPLKLKPNEARIHPSELWPNATSAASSLQKNNDITGLSTPKTINKTVDSPLSKLEPSKPKWADILSNVRLRIKDIVNSAGSMGYSHGGIQVPWQG